MGVGGALEVGGWALAICTCFCPLQRYDPVVRSGNLYTNKTLSAEISAFCSRVNWDEAVGITVFVWGWVGPWKLEVGHSSLAVSHFPSFIQGTEQLLVQSRHETNVLSIQGIIIPLASYIPRLLESCPDH